MAHHKKSRFVLYKTDAKGTGEFYFTDRETGKRRLWDPYKPTKKSLSVFPPTLFLFTAKTVQKRLIKYGRKSAVLLTSFIKAGLRLGFRPSLHQRITGKGTIVESVIWNSGIIPVAEFMALGQNWKKSEDGRFAVTNLEGQSPAMLRFGTDVNNGRAGKIFPFRKRPIT